MIESRDQGDNFKRPDIICAQQHRLNMIRQRLTRTESGRVFC